MGEKLSEIAAGMIARLAATGERQLYSLPGGLNIALSQTGVWRSLRLSRERVLPSAMEIAVCRAPFHVPRQAEPREVVAVGAWRAVALSWKIEIELIKA